MALLIDGYNLLHVTGFFGRKSGPGSFQQTREALLNFLAASLAEFELQEATVVFDAAEAPPGLPHSLVYKRLQVRYATDYPDADTLIEELIDQHDAPRKLLVVSSDKRIQRAARRRRSKYIDSDRWYADLWQRRSHARKLLHQSVPEKPMGELSAAEVAYWVAEFSRQMPDDLPIPELSSLNEVSSAEATGVENPFPPGYGEDLLEEE